MSSRRSEPATAQQLILLVIPSPFSALPFDHCDKADCDGDEVTGKLHFSGNCTLFSLCLLCSVSFCEAVCAHSTL